MASPVETVEILIRFLTESLMEDASVTDAGQLGMNVTMCFRAFIGMSASGYPY